MKQDERLIKKQIEENYNDENLKSLDDWIDNPNKSHKTYRIISKRSKPCEVNITAKSQEICADIILK